MTRAIVLSVVIGLLIAGGLARPGRGPSSRPSRRRRPRTCVTLRASPGSGRREEHFVAGVHLGQDGKPVDAGKVPQHQHGDAGHGADDRRGHAAPDKRPGRYQGTISFPDSGARQVTVTWDGPAGKGSTRFSVPVR